MTQELQVEFSEAAAKLNHQLDRALTLIRDRKLGVSAEITIKEYQDEYRVGFDKIQNRWQFYYKEDGMKKPIDSAPVVARLALSYNLDRLWQMIVANYKTKKDAILEAAEEVDKFCSTLEQYP